MRVAVHLVAHNAETFIRESVESILEQNGVDLRLIIVNDGSTDRTAELIDGFEDPRIIKLHLPAQSGIATARNLAMTLMPDTDFYAVMDADDVADRDRLRLQLEYMESHPRVHILGAHVQLFDHATGSMIDTISHPSKDAEIKARLLLLNGTALSHPTTLMRADFLKRHWLRYPPPVRGHLGVDHDFWISCIPFGVEFAAIEKVLLRKRRHDRNVSKPSRDGGVLAAKKTISRTKLLSHYYPELSFSEATAIASLFEEGKQYSIADFSLAYAAAKQALRDNISYFGESKDLLSQFVNVALQKRFTELKGG